jgi:hypothetical protein
MRSGAGNRPVDDPLVRNDVGSETDDGRHADDGGVGQGFGPEHGPRSFGDDVAGIHDPWY